MPAGGEGTYCLELISILYSDPKPKPYLPAKCMSTLVWAVPQEGMEDWDQETLEKVVAQKHGAEKPSNSTDIVCKYFLDAVEKRLYGWCAAGPIPGPHPYPDPKPNPVCGCR